MEISESRAKLTLCFTINIYDQSLLLVVNLLQESLSLWSVSWIYRLRLQGFENVVKRMLDWALTNAPHTHWASPAA